MHEHLRASTTPGSDVHRVRATVLGIDVEFASNDPAVLELTMASFGAAYPVAPTWARCEAVVQIVVDDAAAPTHAGVIRHESTERGISVNGGGCLGLVDVSLRTAMAVVAPATVQDRDRFRDDVLEALTFGLLTRLDRQPLHAAALARSGTVLLLHGSSGAGKSTLALAAAAAGIEAVADDMVFVQEHPRIRVWTRASAFHVVPAAARQLGFEPGGGPVRVRNGVTKIVIGARTPVMRAFDRFGLCVLGPPSAQPRLTTLTPEEAVERIDVRADAGFDHFADTTPPLLRRIAHQGAWLLEPSAEPYAAVPLLARMLENLAAGMCAT